MYGFTRLLEISQWWHGKEETEKTEKIKRVNREKGKRRKKINYHRITIEIVEESGISLF